MFHIIYHPGWMSVFTLYKSVGNKVKENVFEARI